MIEKCILHFCALSHSAFRMLNLHIFARIQCCFHTPTYFQGKIFIPQQTFIVLFQPPSKYLLPPIPVILKGELQRQNKLISSEKLFKILQNETKIIKIDQAVLEIFNFKYRDLDNFTRKNDTKTENVVF